MQAQLAGSMFSLARQRLPVQQAARQLQAGAQHVARKIKQLPRRQVFPQKLHAGFIELVRLVKDGDPHRRQQLGHTGFADRQVGKKQVVIDDHHVRRQSFPARVIDMAGAKSGAWGAETVFPGGSHPGNDRRPLIQAREFRQVTGAGHARPLLHLRQCMKRAALRKSGIVARHLHPVQAKITATPFEQRGADRYA